MNKNQKPESKTIGENNNLMNMRFLSECLSGL